MARIELEITGNATGLENASKKAAGAVSGLTKSTAMSKAEIEAWDAAARRNTMEQYGNDAKRAANSVKGLSSAQRELNQSTSKLTTEIKGANTVGIEFSRIIQDAPFGIVGVSNNITQLTQSFANLRAQTGSTIQALGIAFRSMFSGANLLVLGVSAATTALTLYNMWARKNKKDTDDLANSTRVLATEQSVLSGAFAGNDYKKAVQNISDLRINIDLAREGLINKRDVVNQYNKAIGDVTGKLNTFAEVEKFITDNSDAYIKAMLLRSAATLALEKAAEEAFKAQQALNQTDEESVTYLQSGLANSNDPKVMELYRRNAERNRQTIASEHQKDQAAFEKIAEDLRKQAAELAKQFNFNLFGSAAGGSGDSAIKAAETLRDNLAKLQQESIQAILTGYAKELQASQYKYDELKRQADEYYRQGKISAREYADYIARLQGFRVGEAGRITGGAGSVPLGQRPSTTGVVPIQLPNQVAKVLASDPVWDAFVDDLDKQLGRAVSSFGRDFLRTLTTINQQAGATIGGVVSSIISSLTGGITEVMSTVFSKQLGDAIQGAFGSGGLGKTGTYGAAGAAILGSIISGSTKRTSTGYQALGGALAGAGTGAALGSVVPGLGTAVGAVVGAVVGALGGIFGASSAKKQEKQQEAMLAEQRKQTALLERQNALTYASSIVGQMTAGGVVTGIMRDAFGQLVATVKGSDLQFVLQRAGGSR